MNKKQLEKKLKTITIAYWVVGGICAIIIAFMAVYGFAWKYQQGFQDGQANCTIPTEITCDNETFTYTYGYKITNLVTEEVYYTNNKTVIGCVKK